MQVQALAPEYQEIREKEAIQADSNVENYLETLNAKITNLYKSAILTDGWQYTVETNQGKNFTVKIVYTHENKFPGPQTFKVLFQNPNLPQTNLTSHRTERFGLHLKPIQFKMD